MANQFSTSGQIPNIMPGLQMLSGGLQRRAQRRAEFERERVGKEQNKQLREKAVQVFKANDPQMMAEFIGKHPGAKTIFDDMLGSKQQSMVDESKRWLIDNEDPVDMHAKAIESKYASGEDITEDMEDIKAIVSDFDGEKKKREMILAIYDPKSHTAYQQQQQGVGIEKDSKGKPLKLEQLINKRNELPEGSPDKKIYEAAISKEIASPGQAKTRPFIAKLMAEGYIPSTRVTGPMLDAYEAAAVKANEMGTPLTVEGLRKMEFEAAKNRSTGTTAGSRLVLARKQGIESAQGLLKDMQVTSKKLNYNTVKFLGALQKWKKGESNDVDFTEYMTQRSDSLFILGNILKLNGITDKAIEVEEEAFSPTLAPKAFNAWLNTQIRALNRAAKEMNTDYGYNITLLPAFDPGQGGAPTKEQPYPQLPESTHASNPQSKAQPSRRIRNPQTGEVIELINNQWVPVAGGR